MRDVIDLADAASWHLGGHAGLEVLERHAEPGGGRGRHVGGDEAGRHRVGGDAELAEFDGEGLGEALHPGFGRGVVGLAPVAERRTGGQVDDPAVPLIHHVLL